MVKKYLISDRFVLLDRFFPNLFDNPVRTFYDYLVKKEYGILRSIRCFSPYFLLEKYKHKHCKEIEAMVNKTDSKQING